MAYLVSCMCDEILISTSQQLKFPTIFSPFQNTSLWKLKLRAFYLTGRSENLYYFIYSISYFPSKSPQTQDMACGELARSGHPECTGEGQSSVRMELAWEDEEGPRGWVWRGLRTTGPASCRATPDRYPLTTLVSFSSPSFLFSQAYFLFQSLSCKIGANFLEHCVGKTRNLQAHPNGMSVFFGLCL